MSTSLSLPWPFQLRPSALSIEQIVMWGASDSRPQAVMSVGFIGIETGFLHASDGKPGASHEHNWRLVTFLLMSSPMRWPRGEKRMQVRTSSFVPLDE